MAFIDYFKNLQSTFQRSGPQGSERKTFRRVSTPQALCRMHLRNFQLCWNLQTTPCISHGLMCVSEFQNVDSGRFPNLLEEFLLQVLNRCSYMSLLMLWKIKYLPCFSHRIFPNKTSEVGLLSYYTLLFLQIAIQAGKTKQISNGRVLPQFGVLRRWRNHINMYTFMCMDEFSDALYGDTLGNACKAFECWSRWRVTIPTRNFLQLAFGTSLNFQKKNPQKGLEPIALLWTSFMT